METDRPHHTWASSDRTRYGRYTQRTKKDAQRAFFDKRCRCAQVLTFSSFWHLLQQAVALPSPTIGYVLMSLPKENDELCAKRTATAYRTSPFQSSSGHTLQEADKRCQEKEWEGIGTWSFQASSRIRTGTSHVGLCLLHESFADRRRASRQGIRTVNKRHIKMPNTRCIVRWPTTGPHETQSRKISWTSVDSLRD